MLDVQVRRPVAPADAGVVRDLAAAASVAAGHPAVGDGVWRDLGHPGPDTTIVLALDGDEPVGAVHAAATDDAGTVIAGIVLDPTRGTEAVGAALADALVADARDRSVHHLELWAFGADATSDRIATGGGLALERELWQMRVPLPLADAVHWPEGIEVRTFEPGRDEDAWVAVNNRSFVHDPDQGGWTLATLAAREAEPWFDPEGFLLAHDARGLAGFCWTKVHPAAPPTDPKALGEIYVIGVDPDRQGIGLGRALTVGGLASLHARGISIGMLFVDSVNRAAVGMYRALGFEVARADRAYGVVLS
jgi:mycothiol synthase